MGPCPGRQSSVSRWWLRQLSSEGLKFAAGHPGGQALQVSTVTWDECWFIFLFHRTQSRIGSPVSPQHTAPSRTVRRYPASNGQLTSNALPNGNGHEQSSSGPHAVSQEHTLSARGKASRVFALLVVCGGPKKPWTLRTASLGGMEREGQHGHCRGLAENEILLKKDRSGEQNADSR